MGIKLLYPAAVLTNVVGWIFIVYNFGFTVRGWAAAFLVTLCLITAVIDIRTYSIPNTVVLVFLAAGAVYHLVERAVPPGSLILGLLLGFAIPLILALVSGGGIGGGDVKLSGAIGLWLGFPAVLYALFFGALAGSIGGLVLIAAGKKKRNENIPFGPFLTWGFLFVFLFY